MVTILYFMVKTICVTIILNHLWVFVFGSRMYGLWDGLVRWLRIVRVRLWKLRRKYLTKKKDVWRKPETQTTSEDTVPIGKHIHENSAVSETASPVSDDDVIGKTKIVYLEDPDIRKKVPVRSEPLEKIPVEEDWEINADDVDDTLSGGKNGLSDEEKRELMVPADSEPDPDFNTALTYEDMNNMADVLVDNSTDETKIIRAVHTIRHKLSGTQLLAFLENESGFQQKIDNLIDEYMDILSKDLPVECGINRALIRSLTTPGAVRITAKADGLQSAEISLSSAPVEVKNGLSNYIPGDELEGRLTRGETPLTPSYKDTKVDVNILSAVAGANQDEAIKSFDDNELSEWKNDGRLNSAWITYSLERAARVDEICMKLTGWRLRSYPLEIYAGDELIWSGETEKSLGYIHLNVKPVLTNEITIRLKGASKEGDGFGQIVEVAAPAAGELDLFKAKNGDKTNHELRIVEIEFKENLWQ